MHPLGHLCIVILAVMYGCGTGHPGMGTFVYRGGAGGDSSQPTV